MGEFQRKTAGFTHRGIQWNRPADKVPDEQILYGRNIRVPQQTTITQRPGNTTFSNLGGTFTHSIARMTGRNDAGPFDDHLMIIHLWVKQGGTWQLAAHQTTKIP